MIYHSNEKMRTVFIWGDLKYYILWCDRERGMEIKKGIKVSANPNFKIFLTLHTNDG